jgi:outer membrane protein insertion porin family
VAEGDAYNRALVDRSRSQIRALGFFKEVEITDIPGSAPDRTGLQVKVEEQPTGELSFSAGYSSVDQLVVDLGITERNFRGRGQNVRARVSVGSLQQQIEFSFYEPRFLGRNVGAGVDVYRSLSDFTDYSYYRLDAIGTGVRFAFPLTLNTIMTTRYTLRKDEVEASEGFCVPGQPTLRTICSQQGSFLTSLVGYGLRHDRRNDALNPTRGFYAAINQDFAGVGGDVKYIRSEVEGGWYHGFNKDFILSVTGEAGYIQGLGDDQVRLSDRFFKGGTSFRGFESAGIGPRDLNYPDNGALGGKAYAIGAVELTVPTFLPEQYGIKAAVFTQFGTLGQLDDKDKIGDNGLIDPNVRDDLSLRASAGISIFWKSPMGPIRLDFSQVLAKEDYDRTETFKFSTSTRFQ